ncbi:MAG: ROK family protein, partial [Alistipes sp.]|nr:ROK family protein [Alistipes sp.]
ATYHRGTIENPANLWKFRDGEKNPDESRRIFPLVDDISKCFGGVRTLMTNDANAATIGEMVYGNARGMRDFVMITLGTGLGSGFVANGEMIYGHDGLAGEVGHVCVERNGRQCGCGRRGCLEAYVSATGIKRTVFELMATMSEPSKLRDIAFNDLDASMISVAAEQGDTVAKEAFRYTGELLGRALADVVTVTSPEAIFLFGGLSKAGKLIFEPTQWYMEENMMFTFKNKVKLLPSGIQSKNAAILGASALIWQAAE